MVLRTRGSDGTGLPRRGAALMALPLRATEKPDYGRRRLLLRMRGERPPYRSAEQRHEVAAHSITSSARASSVGGTSRPRARAVFRLMISSYLVGACTGRSAGLSPLRTRST